MNGEYDEVSATFQHTKEDCQLLFILSGSDFYLRVSTSQARWGSGNCPPPRKCRQPKSLQQKIYLACKYLYDDGVIWDLVRYPVFPQPVSSIF